MFGAGNGGIKINTKIHNGWQVSYRSLAPESKDSDAWIPAMTKLAAAYSKVKLSEPRVHCSFADMNIKAAMQRKKRSADNAALKVHFHEKKKAGEAQVAQA